MKSLEIVHVVWVDSMSDASWCEREHICGEISSTISVGIKVKETENAIVLALSYDPETDSVNCYKHIPYSAIISVKTLCKIKTTT